MTTRTHIEKKKKTQSECNLGKAFRYEDRLAKTSQRLSLWKDPTAGKKAIRYQTVTRVFEWDTRGVALQHQI
jgi:hypothetical protein